MTLHHIEVVSLKSNLSVASVVSAKSFETGSRHVAAAKDLPIDGPLLPVGLGASDHGYRFPEHGNEEPVGAVHYQLFIGWLKEECMIRGSHQNHHGLWTEPEAKHGTTKGIPTAEYLHPVTIKGGQMAQQGHPARH